MRRKYNNQVLNANMYERSNIRKFFGDELQTALNPDASSIHVDFDSLYVKMPHIEEQLASRTQNMQSDGMVFLTGVTGCGKTSVLCHMYEIDEYRVHIKDSTLYIPFTFDNKFLKDEMSITNYYIAVIRNAYEIVESKLQEEQPTMDGLAEYIATIQREALNYSEIHTSTQERLDALRDEAALEYEMLRLKYLLSIYKKITSVILIVDDIEAVGYEHELVPIDLAMILWCCLKYQPQNRDHQWSSGLIIACRHYVYRMLKTRQLERQYSLVSKVTSQTLEAYPLDQEININKPVALIDIVRQRMSALKKVDNKKGWDQAYEITEYILEKIDNNLGEFLTAVCLYNLRTTLIYLTKILYNKRWIQRDWMDSDETPGSFSIDSVKKYNLNPPCLLRAIALDEGNVYDGNDSIIHNIMYNTAEPETDLLSLVVLRAFMRNDGGVPYDWRETVERSLISDKLHEVLPKESYAHIEPMINYLIKKRILLRGSNQAQDDGLDLDDETISRVTTVYVSQAAYLLWQQLGRSSVLYELYSDDIYIDYNSSDLGQRRNFLVFDEATFERCLNHLEAMVGREKDIWVSAQACGKLEKLKQLIGPTFITEQLYTGLFESHKAYYRSDPKYTDRLSSIKKMIYQSKSELAK